MNSKFILLNKVYLMMEYYSKILDNYPKSQCVLKQNIEKTYYDMVENLFSYNINTSDRIKQKYLKDFIIKVSMIDFYIKISFEKKIISKKQFTSLGNKIYEIRKISYKLIKNETSENESL